MVLASHEKMYRLIDCLRYTFFFYYVAFGTEMFLVFLLYALFASVFTVAKEALAFSSPFFLVGSRMVVAGICMLCYQLYKNPRSIVLKREDWVKVCLLGFFNIYLTNVLELWGLHALTSFKTCFLYSLSPFISALFSFLILNEKMTRIKWVGLIIGFLGCTPLLMSQDGAQEALLPHFWFFSLAELSVLGAVITSVCGWILLKQLVHGESQCSPITANGYSMLIGGFFASIHSFIIDGWNPLPVTNWPIFFKCTLFLIIISNIVAYNLYGFLLKKFSANFMSFAGLSTPLFTALFGHIFHNESVSYDFFLSLTIVTIGLSIFYSQEIKETRHLPLQEEMEEEPLLP